MSKNIRVDGKDLSLYLSDNGLWLTVYGNLGVKIPNALTDFNPGKKKGGSDFCPLHGGKSGEAFGLFKDADMTGGCFCNTCGNFKSGYSFLMELFSWTYPEVLQEVAKASGYLDGLDTGEFKKPKPNPEWERIRKEQKAREAEQDEKRKAKLKELWEGAHKLTTKAAMPGVTYLRNRGISISFSNFGDEVRYHPGIHYWHKKKSDKEAIYYGKFPALLSVIRNPQGKPCNLHQTFITEQGTKAPVPEVKKVRARIESQPISGGGLQLCPPTSIIGVGEGLETVASVIQAIGLPMWGLLNASMMGSWLPPVGTKIVLGWEDPDEAGIRCGMALDERLKSMGIKYIPVNPIEYGFNIGEDWNDILLKHGADAFPHKDWANF